MSHDPQEFSELRRLLALKRHEQPPPGYFDRFSNQVISRIKAGEKGEPDSILSRLFGEAAWLPRLSSLFEAKPAFAGACGAAVCALLVAGIVYSESAPAPVGLGLMTGERTFTDQPALAMGGDMMAQPQVIFNSTNPVAPSSAPSLFDQIPLEPVQDAGFEVPASRY